MENDLSVPLSHIREEIQTKLGKRILYTSDCQTLSEQIQILAKRQVSVSTLKRFFRIIKSPFTPSKYTLDTLAIFLEYPDWQAYLVNFEKAKVKNSHEISWERTQQVTNEITTASLKSIKSKIGSRFKNFPLRRFAEKKVEAFLHSPKNATAFVAPDGMGKSTIVAQIAEKFFLGEKAKYPDDIICLIDGNIFYNLLSRKQYLSGLSHLIEYNPLNNFSLFFREHPDQVKGRLVLILDGIDDFYPENGKIDYFIDNLLNIISSFENIHWFKILITCSPVKWRRFLYRIQQNHLLKSCWFNVSFQGTDEEIINIPLLRKREIKAIFKKHQAGKIFDELSFKNVELINLLNHPYLLHLFLLTYQNNNEIRDIDLLNLYISKLVLSAPFSEEKLLIIKSFIELCDYGKNGVEIKKEDLHLTASLMMGYNELIRNQILFEYSNHVSYHFLEIYVKFSQNILFSYFLANILIKNNQLSIGFLRSLVDGYKSMPNLQCNILRYIVKILFKEERTELLKDIFSIFETCEIDDDDSSLTKLSSVLTNTVGIELRRNQRLREILIPQYAQSETARHLYFTKFFDMDNLVLHSGNDLSVFLQYNHSDKARRYVCFMKFMQYFLSNDKERCKAEYEKSINMGLSTGDNQKNTAIYFIPQIIYQSVYERKLNPQIVTAIYTESRRLLKNGYQSRNNIPNFEFTIIFVLNYGSNGLEIIDISQYVFENYDLENLESSYTYQFFLSVYSRALLETGDTEKALKYYNQVRFKNINIPENMKYYLKIRYLLINAQFLIYKGKIAKARKQLRKIKSMSLILKFSYFYSCAHELESTILVRS